MEYTHTYHEQGSLDGRKRRSDDENALVPSPKREPKIRDANKAFSEGANTQLHAGAMGAETPGKGARGPGPPQG